MEIDRADLKEAIAESLGEATCSRVAVLSLVSSIGFGIYGASSIEVFRQFIPQITLWDNVWPRMLFNSIPFFLQAWFVKSRVFSSHLRCLFAMVATPLIFAVACTIYAWPVMWSGQPDLYGYLHGANIFVITIMFIYFSPPIRYLTVLLAGFILLFAAPVVLILLKNNHDVLLYMFLGDVSVFFPVMFFVATRVAKLREELETRRIVLEEKVTPFLGDYISMSIHQNKPEMLQDKILCGIIMHMDIRGFSKITQTLSSEQLGDFIKTYQNKVVKSIDGSQGYLHKSMGDGHLISFGLLDVPSLADIPALKDELAESEERRMFTYTLSALKFYERISRDLEEILTTYGLMGLPGIGLAASLIHGEVRVSVIGDSNHRLDFDIGGSNIARSVRLQEYSKVIRCMSDAYTRQFNAILVVGTELEKSLTQLGVEAQQIMTIGDKAVRDFPSVEKLYFIVKMGEATEPRLSS